MPIIEVDHITKEYRLGAMHGLKQTLLNTASRLAGKKTEERPLFKALDDVNFSIEAGEVVGIIGHNGAGKSTLLKMLARISTPTYGSLNVQGRIAPLIEVGAGFVADFTGRENVYLNGAILGMSRQEIDRKFDEIVSFAEMEEFIDTPVKRYSSGMQVKLAFAVATSIEADILIVDEVLAVGDLAFQRKCFDRMEDMIRREGKTVLLVSHNIRQVERLCSRVILLSHGKVLANGSPKQVCNQFYEIMDALTHKKISQDGGGGDTVLREYLELIELRVCNDDGETTEEVLYKKPVHFVMVFDVRRKLSNPIFAIGLHTTDLLYLTANRSNASINLKEMEKGLHEIRFSVDSFPLLPSTYSVRVSVVAGDPAMDCFYAENILSFKVVEQDFDRSSFVGEGFIELGGQWRLSENAAVAARGEVSPTTEIY